MILIQLVITEKPSVARAIAQVLGASDKRDGYFEGNGWLVGWCVGHLVELAPADAYDPRYSKWTYADLPIVPGEWQYRVLPDTRKQYNILVRSGYAAREGRHLVPTEKGLALAWAMPDQLKSAKLTAEWEERLGAVERGELAPEEFMAGIVEMLRGLVRSYANVSVASSALSRSGRTVMGKCPRCGKDVVEGKKSFFCEGYYDTPPCGFALWKNNRFFASKRKELTRKITAALLRDGRAHVTNLFSERKGVFYDATVVMVDDGGKYVRFELEFDKRKGAK